MDEVIRVGTNSCKDGCLAETVRDTLTAAVAQASTKKDCAMIQLSLQPRRSPRNAQIPSSLFSSHINAITPAPNQLSAPRPCRSFVHVQICQRLLLRHYTLSGAAAALYIICHINMNYVSLLRARLWIASPCGLSIWYARPRVEEC